jgi:acylphosphatase
MKHLNIRVRGHVQGVGFRYSALRAARSLDIRGFARNERDGSVYMEAEGNDENLRLFIDWCRKGPGYGRVDEVLETESNLQGFDDFRIIH